MRCRSPGVPAIKAAFEPLVPGTFRVPNTNIYRAPVFGDDPKAFGRWAADQIEAQILVEGPDTVAAVFLEPVQNAGGCFPPPPGYFDRVREICDRYDVLLVSDEVICAFGRLGTTFGCDKFRLRARHDHLRQGHDVGVLPIGAVIASDRVMEPFLRRGTTFPPATRSAGTRSAARWPRPTSTSSRTSSSTGTCRENEGAFRTTLEKLLDLPIVGDVRGDGYFYAIELVKDSETRERFDADERERLLRGFLPKALLDAGLYCRADDRGDSVIQLAPPLICGQPEFDEMESMLRSVLTEAPSVI